MLDYAISGAFVVDGSGRPGQFLDIGIKDGKIAHLGKGGSLSQVEAGGKIDGRGKIVAPGFIDIHAHDDLVYQTDPYFTPKLMQGVTTVLFGMCGASAAPGAGLSFEGHVAQLGTSPLGINVATAVGHGTIREFVLGFEKRRPRGPELEKMKALVKEAMQLGAFGLSTGLIYPPGCYGDTTEITALASQVAPFGGIYFTHMRSESTAMEEAIQEAVTIGEQAKIPVHIAHFKCLGRQSWQQAGRRLALLDQARKKIAVSCDQYPYTANATGLAALLPPAAQVGGKERLLTNLADPAYRQALRRQMEKPDPAWENMYLAAGGWSGLMINSCPGLEEYQGMTIAAIAQEMGLDGFAATFDLLLETGGEATMTCFTMSEDDVAQIMKYPYCAIGSDGMQGGHCHPRHYGTFARVLAKYVRELGVLSLEEAIRKMTSLPAGILGLQQRGRVKEGYQADLTIFGPDFQDEASYKNPRRFPTGIFHVIVNGELVMDYGKPTGATPGQFLRRKGGY